MPQMNKQYCFLMKFYIFYRIMIKEGKQLEYQSFRNKHLF